MKSWILITILGLFLPLGCGPIGLGGGTPNDPAPTSGLLVSGGFTGLNGKTVSGSAEVYASGTGTYIFRLSGVSFPQETGMQIILVVSGTTQSAISLRATSGSQNYTVTPSGGTVFQQARIHSTFYNLDYAQATLN